MKVIKNFHIRDNNNEGFTLIEVIVALMIISTVMVSLISLEIQNVRGHNYSVEGTKAMLIARSYMERLIRQQKYDPNMTVEDPSIQDNYPNVKVETKVEDISVQDEAWAMYIPENTEVKILKVIVHWYDDGKLVKDYSLVTYIERKMK